jgi:putative transposase
MTAEGVPRSDLLWLTKVQIDRMAVYFLLSHGMPRVDDRRVVSGIVHVIRNSLHWRDAPCRVQAA